MEAGTLAGSRVGEVAGHGKTDTPDSSWLRSGKSYEQALLGSERKGREKRNSPLQPPIEKREGKETRRGFTDKLHDRARTPARTRGTRPPCICTYAEARAAALEIIDNCFGAVANDLDNWAWYCRHFDRRFIVNRAYHYASCQRQGKVRDGVTAFQAWLKASFPKGGAA